MASPSLHDDPADEAPWAMPLAFEVRRVDPSSTAALNEACAIATARLLSDDRVKDEWAPLLERWLAGRIRKVVRRGKPAQLDRTEHLPGLTVVHRGARVRAFLSGSTDALPQDLRRMQVSGSEPPELGEPSGSAFLTIDVNPSLTMTVGKSSAQCAHAAQVALMRMDAPTRERWSAAGFSTRVVRPDQVRWDALVPAAQVAIHDAGFTEVEPGSLTVVASWRT